MSQRLFLYAVGLVAIISVCVLFVIRPAAPAMWLAIVLLIMGILATIAHFWTARRHRDRVFSDRSEMAPDDIFETFYGSSGLSREQFFAVWEEVATTLSLQPGKLRPTDRFGEELRGSWLVDNEIDVLTTRALARAKKQNRELDPSTLQTVDDYVRFFCNAKPLVP